MSRIQRLRRWSWLVAALFVLTGQAASSRAWPTKQAPAELRPAIAYADEVIIELHDALQRELANGLAQGGPAFAVKSCHIDVAGVVLRLRHGEGIAAGRTSDRLRNPANAPPEWAVNLVAANAGRRAASVEGFAVDLGGKVGVLRPIVHRPTCTPCHGPSHNLDPAVQVAVAQRYPRARAIGFSDGEIRGWFWVEVTKRASR